MKEITAKKTVSTFARRAQVLYVVKPANGQQLKPDPDP